jgi:fructokinase
MRIGIDLGGTKIEGIAIADDGTERLRRRIASPRDDYSQTLDAVAGLVRELERDAGVRGRVGVGIPGTISPATGRIKNSNSTWLNGTPLADDLSRMLDRPVRFDNDANSSRCRRRPTARPRVRRWSSASSSAPEPAAASSSVGAW